MRESLLAAKRLGFLVFLLEGEGVVFFGGLLDLVLGFVDVRADASLPPVAEANAARSVCFKSIVAPI